jgi:hypothetical protein
VGARETEIAGRTALWLTGLFTLVAVPMAIMNLFRRVPLALPNDFVIAYLFAILTSFIAYVYGRLEQSLKQRQELLANQRHSGVEVFRTSEAFLEKLMEITIDAESVSTLNLSPARGEHVDLDLYFQRVHHSIRSRATGMRSFRSIASSDTRQKIEFLVERTAELAPTGRASFAVFDQHDVGRLPHPLSFHVTVKAGQTYVFMFPPVDLTGHMDSVLIRDERVAQVMLKYFDALWHQSIRLNEGRRVSRRGLDHLSSLNPTLLTNPIFLRLSERAT